MLMFMNWSCSAVLWQLAMELLSIECKVQSFNEVLFNFQLANHNYSYSLLIIQLKGIVSQDF